MEAYVFDAVRTPRGRGKPGGALYEVPPVQLAAQVLREIADRHSIDTALIEDVVLGCVEPIGDQGGDIARAAALAAGYSQSVAGVQIDRFCGSGLEAVSIAAAKVATGSADFVVGGGVEVMSRIPMGASGGAVFADPDVTFSTYFVPQGVAADLLATQTGHTRDALDAYALRSQQRAARAWSENRFASSVIPVSNGSGEIVLQSDELMRPETTAEGLGSLQPAFAGIGQLGFDSVAIARYPAVEHVRHVHTAGNSSGIADGAAAVLVGSREAGERAGLRPRARIRSIASVGTEPTIMLTGPAPAARKALQRAGMSARDIDLFEVNEAFAIVPLLFCEEMGVDDERVNVNGGAIAFGHPLGATGAMLLGTLIDELERRSLGTGLVTLCVAGGMGTAAVVELV